MGADSGLNKPFDRFAKQFSDEAPRIFLRVLGIVDANAKLTPLRPETSPPVMMPDYVADTVVDGEKPFIFHVEFQLYYSGQVPDNLTRRAASLALQHNKRVKTVLLLFHPAPAEVPDFHEIDFGETRISHKYQVVRLSELDPTAILESGDIHLLAWAVPMNSTEEQVRWVARVIAASGNEEAIARFLTVGGIRYDRSVLEEMLGGVSMGFLEVLVEGSSIFREAREQAAMEATKVALKQGLKQGLEQGIEQGEERGRAGEARALLRSFLREKFPGLETMPEIDSIASVETIESLLMEIAFRATSASALESAIRQAAER